MKLNVHRISVVKCQPFIKKALVVNSHVLVANHVNPPTHSSLKAQSIAADIDHVTQSNQWSPMLFNAAVRILVFVMDQKQKAMLSPHSRTYHVADSKHVRIAK